MRLPGPEGHSAVPRRGGRWTSGIALVSAGLLAVAVPILLPSYWTTVAVLALIGGILALGLNLLMGYTGLDSLGQAAFFGLGSYGFGILTVRYGVLWGLAALLALAVATAAAVVMGMIAVRLRGLYFLLVTAAMSQVLWGADYRWGTFTGGANGLLLTAARPGEWFSSDAHFYYLVLGVCAGATTCMTLIVRSPFGLTLRGIREREVRSQTLGYRTSSHTCVAFVMAAVFAAVAGILNASFNGIASPSDLSLDQSFAAMLMVILGGSGTLAGPLVGAVVLTVVRYALSTLWVNSWPIVLGALYIAATLYLPRGIVPTVQDGLMRWTRRRSAATIEESHGEVSPPTAPVDLRGRDDPGPALVGSPGGVDGGGARRALEVRGLGKAYGDLQVLREVTFAIDPGERVGIIGVNGAGKTTLFHVISGLEKPSQGTVVLFGRDVTRAAPNLRAALGLSRTFQVTLLYPRLTVAENVQVALLGSAFGRHRFDFWRPLARYEALRAQTERVLRACGL